MATLLERITILPDLCHGKPTIRPLRYPVETILELLSSGMTTDEILADYADLERDDILAALAFESQRRKSVRSSSSLQRMAGFSTAPVAATASTGIRPNVAW